MHAANFRLRLNSQVIYSNSKVENRKSKVQQQEFQKISPTYEECVVKIIIKLVKQFTVVKKRNIHFPRSSPRLSSSDKLYSGSRSTPVILRTFYCWAGGFSHPSEGYSTYQGCYKM